MELKLVSTPLEEMEADALIAVAPERDPGSPMPGMDDINRLTGGWIDEIRGSGEFIGKAYETVPLHRPAGLKARRLIVAGAGKQFTPAEVRRAVAAGTRTAKQAGAQSLGFLVPDPSAEMLEAVAEGILLGNWESDRYRTKHERKPVESCQLIQQGAAADASAVIDRARVIAESQNLTRDLQNEPPNVLGPQELAARAKQMAAEVGLECEVLDEDRMRQLGMGSLLAVAQGSVKPPALIILRYEPAGGGASGADHLGLVGKGVTFDTGGISIKPSDNMDKMKYDMSGAAAMVGAMRAIAHLKPRIPVTALIPTVENMPGGRAQRPGDIVTSLSGKTIEVLNTDAEGRLILNDAITYAKRLGCTHLVDAATLTGAIVVALGHYYVGVFSNNDQFRDKLLRSAARQGEKMWPMPVDDEFKDQIKTPFADIANVGGRWGGSITAALFLKEFAEDTPWIHLDIAGTASYDDGKPYAAKGASGIAVRTLVDLAMNW
jgi:leucyl aminopeptidase